MQDITLENKSLVYSPAGQFEETRFEKIHNVIVENSNHGSILAAQEIATLIRKKEKENKPCVRGTGVSYRVFPYCSL